MKNPQTRQAAQINSNERMLIWMILLALLESGMVRSTGRTENTLAIFDQPTAQRRRARSIHPADSASCVRRSPSAIRKRDDVAPRWFRARKYLPRVQSASTLTKENRMWISRRLHRHEELPAANRETLRTGRAFPLVSAHPDTKTLELRGSPQRRLRREKLPAVARREIHL